MRTIMPTLLLASLTTTLGCGAGGAPDFESSIPDPDGLTIDVPTATSSARYRSATTEETDSARCYDSTYRLAHGANEIVHDVLTGLDRITDYPSHKIDDNTYQWGPWDNEDDGVTRTLFVTTQEDGSYEYRFQGDELGGSDFQDLITGTIDAGSTKTIGSGSFTLFLDVYEALGLREDVAGTMDFVYSQDDEEARVIDVVLSQYLFDNGYVEDAWLFFDRSGDSSGQLDWYRDRTDFFDADSSDDVDLQESLGYRARWTPEKAGRCDGTATDGDLGESVYTGHQCWDTSTATVYQQQEIDDLVYQVSGDESACAFADVSFPDSM